MNKFSSHQHHYHHHHHHHNNSSHSNILCNNCNKQGHLFHQCKLPIASYGIILFKFTREHGLQYLMIRRKDSFGFIDFVRGKFSPFNIYQLQNIVDEMSISEKEHLLVESFDKLWIHLWGETTNTHFKHEEYMSSKKFDIIKNGISSTKDATSTSTSASTTTLITLKNIVENSETRWIETEWEFPKGRRNNKEKDLDCALREFEEETGISKHKIHVIENIMPFEETFIGTNHKSYKNKYFIAFIDDEKNDLTHFQVAEVSKMEWCNIDACLDKIRPYNLEKKQLIRNVHTVLETYGLYC